jgi:chromate transporter
MTTPSARPQPESLKDLFFSFTLLAIQGFGGVLAYMERELVERKKWLTRAEFVEEWAVARTMPGPLIPGRIPTARLFCVGVSAPASLSAAS